MIGIGCDHGGYDLKMEIIAMLEQKGFSYKDFGAYSKDAVDYPDIAKPVAKALLAGEIEKGILICGTGIGISIAANKIEGIRCALCSDHFSAVATREHNDANILALGGRTTGPEVAKEIAFAFLTTEFSHDERHQRRINKIEDKN
ncbi:MAG: ribose 5-phosphate isomerase B [Vallitaleaceae bacterium]|nr:ribose 5-phosphate isomerase B [Vallitaleaceae bacterium]